MLFLDFSEEKEACRKILDKYGLTRYQVNNVFFVIGIREFLLLGF